MSRRGIHTYIEFNAFNFIFNCASKSFQAVLGAKVASSVGHYDCLLGIGGNLEGKACLFVSDPEQRLLSESHARSFADALDTCVPGGEYLSSQELALDCHLNFIIERASRTTFKRSEIQLSRTILISSI